MILDIIWLVVSLLMLTVGGTLLVRGATAIAVRMGLSSFFIGLTIVATSGRILRAEGEVLLAGYVVYVGVLLALGAGPAA